MSASAPVAIAEFLANQGQNTFRLGADDNISCYDILKACGVASTGCNGKLSKYVACVQDNGVQQLCATGRWVGATKSISTTNINKSTPIPMMNVADCRRLICYVIRRGLRSEDSINSLLTSFNMDKSMYESAFVSMPEADIVQSIQRAIPYPSTTQFRVGKYRLDLYFPTLRLAVCCDEDNHAKYDTNEEIERRYFITDCLDCDWVNFDPFAKSFSTLDVIRLIVEKICRKLRSQRIGL